ncbi:MAG: hypothetical protein AAF830_10245 [Pseudomonadota bacterium]
MAKTSLLISLLSSAALAGLQASAQSDVRETAPPRQLVIQGSQLAPEPYTARIDDTPDVSQHIRWRQFVGNASGVGRHPEVDLNAALRNAPPAEYDRDMRVFPLDFCGPAAVANNLIWLDRTGYRQISTEPNKHAAGTMLAWRLGFDYMDTMSNYDADQYKLTGKLKGVSEEDITWSDIPEGSGTSLPGLINGTVKFLREKRIPIKAVRVTSSIDRSGANFRTRGAPFQFEVKKPTGDDIAEALRRRSIVVTLHGHYVPLFDALKPPADGASDDEGSSTSGLGFVNERVWDTPFLQRTGGHFAAPVGFGVDRQGNPAPGAILYHDSAGGQQRVRRQHQYNWKQVASGHAGRNPVLVNYRKTETLENEDMRCAFAPVMIENPDGKDVSAECRGNLGGHSVLHYPSSFDTSLKRLMSVGGLPAMNDDTSLKVLEMVIEIEVDDPSPNRLRQR